MADAETTTQGNQLDRLMLLLDPGKSSVSDENALYRGDLIAICERASWMPERLTDAYVAVEGAEADAARARRLAEWKRVVAADSEQRFHRRLEWDGLNEAAVRKTLGP